jgi:Ca-activated chloride channel family protein
MMKTNKIGRAVTIMLWLLLALMFSLPVAAQHIIIDPPFPPPGQPPGRPLPPVNNVITVEEYVVEARVEGPAAQVRVTQTFRNDSGGVVEGQFIFPLPADAAVSDLQMRVNGTVLEGQVMPADEARGIYEAIVRQQRDPALLQYIGQGLFQTNVFPIPAGDSRTIQLTYTQLVTQDQGLYRFSYPLGAGFNALGEQGGLRLRVELIDQPGLRTVYSPNWGATVHRSGDDGAEVVFTGAGSTPESFFDVYWGSDDSAIGANLLSYQPVEEDGYFALLVAPGIEQVDTQVAERDIVLVVDVSGSMEGDKMQQARDAAKYVVDHMNPGDRINLVSFSTGVRLWSDKLEELDADLVADAHEWVERLEAGGSTDINRALLEALAVIDEREGSDANRPVYLLFMTDGLPTQGETDPWKIYDNAEMNAPDDATLRLFTFGVGYDVNTILLDTLSKEMGGRSTYVLPEERIDEAVSAFLQGISMPVLTNVSLEVEGDAVLDEIYPFPLPDLFAGEQLVVVGRYRDGGEVSVRLTGEVNGQTQEFHFDEMTLRERGGEHFVARVWASRKIGVLMEQIRRSGPDPEVIDAIVELSLQYGIVTPYTAYLVEEPDSGVVSPMPGAPTAAMPADGLGGGSPVELAPAARAYAADEAQAMAAAPASGEAAVAASEAQNDMQVATTVQNTESAQFVAGKTFVQQGWVSAPDGSSLPFWVDTAFKQEMSISWVEFASDEYFALTQQPNLAAWLAVGQEMVIVVSDVQAIRVTTNVEEMQRQGNAPMSPLETPEVSSEGTPSDSTADAEEESQSAWDAFWSWVWGE